MIDLKIYQIEVLFRGEGRNSSFLHWLSFIPQPVLTDSFQVLGLTRLKCQRKFISFLQRNDSKGKSCRPSIFCLIKPSFRRIKIWTSNTRGGNGPSKIMGLAKFLPNFTGLAVSFFSGYVRLAVAKYRFVYLFFFLLKLNDITTS